MTGKAPSTLRPKPQHRNRTREQSRQPHEAGDQDDNGGPAPAERKANGADAESKQGRYCDDAAAARRQAGPGRMRTMVRIRRNDLEIFTRHVSTRSPRLARDRRASP